MSTKMRTLRSGLLVTGLVGAATVAACSATNTGSQFGAGGNGAGSGNTNGGDGGNGGDLQTTATVDLDGGSGKGGASQGACAAETTKAETAPLDIYIMLDKSASMDDKAGNGVTKWSAVTSALSHFVQQPGAGGISVGIQYFGLPPGGGPLQGRHRPL